MRLTLIFILTLLISLVVLDVTNDHTNDQFRRAEHQACLNSKLLATNQQRVIRAILAFEGKEHVLEKDGKLDGAQFRYALRHVPTFNC